MNTHAEKSQEKKTNRLRTKVSQKQSGVESAFQFVDNRPEVIEQRKLQEMANNSSQAKQATQLQAMAVKNSAQQEQPIQKKENKTGLPDDLKTGKENLSGMSLDDVKVHRNSDKPAQLQAHAYAQGTDIHLGPGQEKHSPHELGHVVQQKEGRVKPTKQLKGKVAVNDDAGLEKEADVMEAKALQKIPAKQLRSISLKADDTIQRVLIGNDDYGATQVMYKFFKFAKKAPEGLKKALEEYAQGPKFENEIEFLKAFNQAHPEFKDYCNMERAKKASYARGADVVPIEGGLSLTVGERTVRFTENAIKNGVIYDRKKDKNDNTIVVSFNIAGEYVEVHEHPGRGGGAYKIGRELSKGNVSRQIVDAIQGHPDYQAILDARPKGAWE